MYVPQLSVHTLPGYTEHRAVGLRPNCWRISNESPRGKDDGDALDDRCESF